MTIPSRANHRGSSLLWLWLIIAGLSVVLPQIYALSGLVYTDSGYDNPGGSDPVCWSAELYHEEDVHNETHHAAEDRFDGVVWESRLFPDFLSGPVTLERNCPPGIIELRIDAPIEYEENGKILTGVRHEYHVDFVFHIEELREYYGLSEDAFFASDHGHPAIAVTVKFCDINGDFCTPFNYAEEEEHHEDEDEHHEDEDEDHEDEDTHNHRLLHGHRTLLRASTHTRTPDALRRYVAEEDGHAHEDESEDHLDEEEDDGHAEGDGHLHGDVVLEVTEEDVQIKDFVHEHDEHHGEEMAVSSFSPTVLGAPTYIVELRPENSKWAIALDIPVTVDEAGLYLPIVAVQFFLTNATIHGVVPDDDHPAALKVDVANALVGSRTVLYMDPPNIRRVTQGAAIVSYILIGFTSLFLCGLLYCIVKFRKEKVMILAQGSFLIIFQVAGIVAVSCSFLFDAKSDAYCYLSAPLVLLPIQFMLSIIFGRLRRIISLMRPVVEWRQATQSQGSSSESTETVTSRRQAWKPRINKAMKDQRKLRQEFKAWKLWLYVAVFTVPLVILIVVHYVLYPPNLVLELNEAQTIGKYQCGSDTSVWFQFGEILYVYAMFFVLLWESQRSKKLPALFNEADSIAQASLGTIFIATAGLMIVAFSNDPTSFPDVRYILLVLVIVALVLNLSVRLVLPKLQLIWKGENVVVSRMLREHRSNEHSTETSTAKKNGTASSGIIASVNSGHETEPPQQIPQIVKQASLPRLVPSLMSLPEDSETGFHDDAKAGEEQASPNQQDGRKQISWNQDVLAVPAEGRRSINKSSVSEESTASDSTPLILRPGHSPPEKVCVGINVHAQLMERINNRILSGLEVSKADWEQLRLELSDLSDMFSNAVTYNWEGSKKARRKIPSQDESKES